MNKLLSKVMAVVLLNCCTLNLGAKEPELESTRVQFESMAAKLTYLDKGAVLYDRVSPHYGEEAEAEWQEHSLILTKLRDNPFNQEALLLLLEHNSPRVRTLAAVALFEREDPMVLPALKQLCNDKAATFDGHPKYPEWWFHHSGVGPPRKAQSVGGIIRGMIGFYMKQSEFHYMGAEFEERFEEYWQVRKNRAHCAGWFEVQLLRASQNKAPIGLDRAERIGAVRRRIDKLTGDERAWVLLRLYGENGSEMLVTEEELVAACRNVGPEKLLLMLRSKIPCDDPDLQPQRENDWPYSRGAIFVLAHAKQCFRPQDSETLLAYERWYRDDNARGEVTAIITPWWAIGAAQLNPPGAPAILKSAMLRFNGEFRSFDRESICIAMWQLAGAAEIGFVLDCLYSEDPDRGLGDQAYSFFGDLKKEPNAREFIVSFVNDPRFDGSDWNTLEHLVRLVNQIDAIPVVTEDDLRKAYHPLSTSSFRRDRKEAAEKYPKETAELLKRIAAWRECLRKRVLEWKI